MIFHAVPALITTCRLPRMLGHGLSVAGSRSIIISGSRRKLATRRSEYGFAAPAAATFRLQGSSVCSQSPRGGAIYAGVPTRVLASWRCSLRCSGRSFLSADHVWNGGRLLSAPIPVPSIQEGCPLIAESWDIGGGFCAQPPRASWLHSRDDRGGGRGERPPRNMDPYGSLRSSHP